MSVCGLEECNFGCQYKNDKRSPCYGRKGDPVKFKERKRRHDDAHIPMGGKGKRGTTRKNKAAKSSECTHPMITTGVIDRCSYCKAEMPLPAAPTIQKQEG